MRKLGALIAIAAAVAFAPRDASAQQRVTCESYRNSRQICEVNTSGGVAFYRQLSNTTCVRGQTWGYTRNAIWVRNGCRAEFVVNPNGRYGSGRYDDRYDNRYNNRRANRYDSGSAQALCRQTVRNLLKRNVAVETWMMNSSDNNTRVGWRVNNGPPGECRIDRNGRVTLR